MSAQGVVGAAIRERWGGEAAALERPGGPGQAGFESDVFLVFGYLL